MNRTTWKLRHDRPPPNPFGARGTLTLGGRPVTIYRLPELARQGLGPIDRLPFSVRVLLENALRWCGQGVVTEDHVRKLAAWPAQEAERPEIPFMPARVVLQDFTGVPCVVDLAAMRDAMAEMGGDPDRINPVVPCDLVIDHSVQVDHYGTADAFRLNVALEFDRNAERYQLLKFAQRAFHNFRVVPPGHGHRPPGQPRAPLPGHPAAGAARPPDRLSRHPRRHRLAHHDDQRPGRRRAGASAGSRPRP